MTATPPLLGALVGCGSVARYHLEAWTKVGGVRLTAVCDIIPERSTAAIEGHSGANAYGDARRMFESESLDFVEICTLADSHRPLVELAARHGVNVLCQKPAANDRGDLVAMIDACDSAGVRLMFHENWRFRPWNRALRSEIEAGTIGRPIRLRIAHRDTRALRSEGFGGQPTLATAPRLILMDMGCHLIDTSRYLLGEIKAVNAVTGRFGVGHPGEDLATLSVCFESGALGLLDMTWCASPALARPEWALNETVVEGTAGALSLQADGSLRLVGIDGRAERRPVTLPSDDEVYVNAFVAAQAHFIEGLRSQFAHETNGPDTLKTMDVVWAAYRSAEEGRTVLL